MFEDIVYETDFEVFTLFTNNVLYKQSAFIKTVVCVYVYVPGIGATFANSVMSKSASVPSAKQIALFKLKHGSDIIHGWGSFSGLVDTLIAYDGFISRQCEAICSLMEIYKD